jgi:hypothetical protein
MGNFQSFHERKIMNDEYRTKMLHEEHIEELKIMNGKNVPEIEFEKQSIMHKIYKINEYFTSSNYYKSKFGILGNFNKFIHVKEIVYLYSTNNMEYYQCPKLDIYIRYDKKFRQWSEFDKDIIMMIPRQD